MAIIVPDDVKVSSLYKALKLLEYFNPDHPERGVSELAELSGINKASIYNILNTFEHCGFIVQNKRNNRYGLGMKFLEKSAVLNQQDHGIRTIKRQMQELCQETGETVFFATPYGCEVIYREAVYPSRALTTRMIQGIVAPMYCTGIGKAMLAASPETLLDEVIAQGLKPHTENTIVRPEPFREEIARTRQRGYSIDNMEHEYGIKCVGIALLNQDGELIGALSLTGPSLRFGEEQIALYAQKLRVLAERIARSV